jgi:hypothetical protein
MTNADILSTSVFNMKPPRKFVGLEGLKKFSQKGSDAPILAEAKEPLEWKPAKLSIDKGIRDTSVKFVPPPSKEKNILIAIPTNKYIEPETFKSIYDLIIPSGYAVEFQYFYGYTISQIRNLIGEWGKRYDYLFCVDSDIVLPNNALVKLLKADKYIVSGCYVQRLHNNTLELFEANGLGGVVPISVERLTGELISVDACGFGCVLINSVVLRAMKYPHFIYTEALDHKNTISEDIYFCTKAKLEHGYTIWADTSLICKHIGAHYYVPVNPNDTLKSV